MSSGAKCVWCGDSDKPCGAPADFGLSIWGGFPHSEKPPIIRTWANLSVQVLLSI